MTTTDGIALILSLLFLVRGASRGFMLSLMAPFSIIAATVISIIYYQITKDLIVSLLLGLIGPFLLGFLLKLIIKTWGKTADRKKPGFLSRLGGALLTFAWGWVFIIFTLLLFALMPPLGKTLTDARNDVLQSTSYLIAKPFGEMLFPASKQNDLAGANASANDTQSLAEDPRFQAVLRDPEVQNEIAAHDIVKLMSNPKMMALTQQIMSDPATMKKVFALYRSQAQSPQAGSSTSGPSK